MKASIRIAQAAHRWNAALRRAIGGEAGVIIVDRLGRIGYAHNAEMMEFAIFTPAEGIRHHRLAN